MFWVNYTQRLTLRLRSIFLTRNYKTIYILILFSAHSLRAISVFSPNAPFWSKIGLHLFTRFIGLALTHPRYLKRTLVGQNFHKSMHYQYLQGISNTILNPVLRVKAPYFDHYLYVYSTSLVQISTTSKFIKYVVNQILQYWLNIWVQQPKFFKVKLAFLSIPSWWQLVYFTNVFYFKVYNT